MNSTFLTLHFLLVWGGGGKRRENSDWIPVQNTYLLRKGLLLPHTRATRRAGWIGVHWWRVSGENKKRKDEKEDEGVPFLVKQEGTRRWRDIFEAIYYCFIWLQAQPRASKNRIHFLNQHPLQSRVAFSMITRVLDDFVQKTPEWVCDFRKWNKS